MRALACVLVLAMAGAQEPVTKPAAPDPQTPAEPQAAPTKGRQGGWLGLHLREAAGGVEVTGVVKGSEAEALGFAKGDVVRAVDGQRVRNGDDFLKRLWSTAAIVAGRRGEKASHTIAVERGGKKVEIAAGLDDLDARPRQGDLAPDFTLPTLDGKGEVTLSKLAEKKRPIVLIFGSFT